MKRPVRVLFTVALLLAVSAGSNAQNRDDYQRRTVDRFIDLFQTLDRDGDGTVTRFETQGDVNFPPHFDDIDVNRDGIVTKGELDRYLEQQHGMRPGGA